jgi:hypothetical protein
VSRDDALLAMDEYTLVVPEIGGFARFGFVFLRFGVIHILPSDAVAP